MILTSLKDCRLAKGYSLRQLAKLSGVDFTTIDRLERFHRPAQDRTVHKLANALGVEPIALYAVEQPKLTKESIQTPTASIKPIRSTRSKAKPAISFWLIEKDQEDDLFRTDNQDEAERLKVRLGGQQHARVYQAVTKFEAQEQHRQFLIRVIRGHDAW